MSKKNGTPFIKRAYGLGLKAVLNFMVLTEEQVAFYEEHLDEIPEALRRGFIIPEEIKLAEPVETKVTETPQGKKEFFNSPPIDEVATPGERFKELADLGVVTLPNESSMGGSMLGQIRRGLKRLGNPAEAEVSAAGRRFHVRAWGQAVQGSTTLEEHISFLLSKNSALLGEEGARLVFKQKGNLLHKGHCYLSFGRSSDENENIPGLDVFRYQEIKFSRNNLQRKGFTEFYAFFSFEEAE